MRFIVVATIFSTGASKYTQYCFIRNSITFFWLFKKWVLKNDKSSIAKKQEIFSEDFNKTLEIPYLNEDSSKSELPLVHVHVIRNIPTYLDGTCEK